MSLVGFKRATIGILDNSGQVIDQYVVEGKQDEGATTTAEITGLSKEPTRVYGSDIAYYIARRGTGDVVVNLSLLDLPDEVNDTILGYKTNDSGVTLIGEDTEAPYCSLLLESSNLQNETALLGFFKGTFSKDGTNIETLNGETFEPQAEAYTFSAVAYTGDGEANGNTVAQYIGNEETAIEEVKRLVLPSASELPGA